MRVVAKVFVFLQLMVEIQIVVLLGFPERIAADRLVVTLPEGLPGLAHLAHELFVRGRV